MPATHPIKGEKNSPLGYNIPSLHFYMKELPYENGSQPYQNLGGHQTTTCYFAAQFENTSQEAEKFMKKENREKGALYNVF